MVGFSLVHVLNWALHAHVGMSVLYFPQIMRTLLWESNAALQLQGDAMGGLPYTGSAVGVLDDHVPASTSYEHMSALT